MTAPGRGRSLPAMKVPLFLASLKSGSRRSRLTNRNVARSALYLDNARLQVEGQHGPELMTEHMLEIAYGS
jgi:hypothetical protein